MEIRTPEYLPFQSGAFTKIAEGALALGLKTTFNPPVVQNIAIL